MVGAAKANKHQKRDHKASHWAIPIGVESGKD
jgi:hypothetical protein